MRRRHAANRGVPGDENPTDILDLRYGDPPPDDPYDDLFDEGVDDERDDLDADGTDDDRAVPEYFDDERDEPPKRRTRRKRGRRFLGWLIALTVIVLLAGVAYYGARELLGIGYEDYDGTGETDVLLEVSDGDTTGAIADKLEKLDVVASADAFVAAGEDDQRVLGIQPGYYTVKTKMSGTAAVEAIAQPDARVGVLQLRAGTQVDDVRQPDGSVTPGMFSLLSKASCAKLNGESTCVSPEQLRETVATSDLGELGVPEWAVADASKAEPKRRLEGVVQPGVYDVKPGMDAKQLLQSVLEKSTVRLQAAGLPDAADGGELSPYQVLTIASIVEREGVETDFGKIARVIQNRIGEGMRLEMDSTVNYVLDRPQIRTNEKDRNNAGPYNTYRNEGLPPTPIGAPSLEAIQSAVEPDEGPWQYFVKCETNGLSCFAKTYEEHQRNVEDAQRRGVF